MTPEHLPAFTDALYVVIGLAVVVGFIVIFQAMYTAVLERTREIGILKSLGASQTYIVRSGFAGNSLSLHRWHCAGRRRHLPVEEGDGHSLPQPSLFQSILIGSLTLP